MKTFDKVLPSLQKERRNVQHAMDQIEVERKALREKARSLDRAIKALSLDGNNTPDICAVRESVQSILKETDQLSESELRQRVRDDLKQSGFNFRGVKAKLDAVFGEPQFENNAGTISVNESAIPDESPAQTVADSTSQADA